MNRTTKLSILIPLYNEEEFVATLLERVIAAPLPDGMEREIIVSDDGSTDDSIQEVQRIAAKYPTIIKILRTKNNEGKGSALKRAIAAATGDFSIIQDADLEYNPKEYTAILTPLVDGRADVVYGSRFVVASERRVLFFWHSLANHILTGLCNVFSDLNLTDMETCYKAFRTSLLKSIPIHSQRFGFEPEITIKLAKRQARIFEVPISYNGRTYDEGKKIGLRDAFDAVWVIVKTFLSNDIYVDKDKAILDAFSDAPNFNKWMSDTIKPFVGKQVFEIGAGMGNLTRVLIAKRTRYVATDLDLEHLERLRFRLQGRTNLETTLLDASKADQFTPYSGQMDTVVCLNVLEHIEDDLGALQNMRSILSPGGKVIILVPEGQSIFNGMDEELGHYRRYSEDQLQKRLEEAGFTMQAMLRFNRVSRPGWWFNGSIMKRRTISRIQLKNFDRLVWLFRRIDSMIPWSPTSIIAIGRNDHLQGKTAI